MTLPTSDLHEKEIRRWVRTEDENWPLLIEDILSGRREDWDLREDTYPHAVGWLFQYSREVDRKKAFRLHIGKGDKHRTTFQTTQIFTPRWLADRLCDASITRSDLRIHDPAVGAGQFLLAAYKRLKFLGATPKDAAQQISGSDLDESALKVAAYVLRRCFLRDGVRIEPKLYKADLLSEDWKADLTLTNPPFLGRRSMDSELLEKIDHHRPFHFDLFAATIHRALELSSENIAIVAPQSFWFIERFREARSKLLSEYHLSHFYLLGRSTFQALSGAKSASAGFCLTKKNPITTPTQFFDLRELPPEEKNEKAKQVGTKKIASEVANIPGAGLSFFLAPTLRNAFSEMTPLGEIVEIPGGGNKTANNKKYLRELRALSEHEIRNVEGVKGSGDEKQRWVVYSKGGKFAPWWGNWDYAVDWSQDAQDFYAKNRSSNLLAERYRFRPGLTYSDLSSVGLAVRRLPAGTLFDMTGPAIFAEDDDREFLDGLMVILNSTAVREIVNALNPTLHVQVRDLRRVPIPVQHIRAFSKCGAELVDSIQQLMKNEDPSASQIREFLDLEFDADQRVCALYGFHSPKRKRLKHHKIRI